jgi:hypothetical protein
MQAVLSDITCATEVFVATALLQREHPNREDFSIQEIVQRAARENITGEIRSGVNVHASLHCVGNKEPNPNKHKMLFATSRSDRRLLRPGDEVKQGRTGKIFPDADEIPERYLPLLEWAKDRYYNGGKSTPGAPALPSTPSGSTSTGRKHLQAFLDAKGIGIEMAKGIDLDAYLRELREGWE